jgi:hypothetical protein
MSEAKSAAATAKVKPFLHVAALMRVPSGRAVHLAPYVRDDCAGFDSTGRSLQGRNKGAVQCRIVFARMASRDPVLARTNRG